MENPFAHCPSVISMQVTCDASNAACSTSWLDGRSSAQPVDGGAMPPADDPSQPPKF